MVHNTGVQPHFCGVMCFDATDILVRRVERHHPGVDDARRQAHPHSSLHPQRAKVCSHSRTARLPALDPCHVHVLTAPCPTRSCRQARASSRRASPFVEARWAVERWVAARPVVARRAAARRAETRRAARSTAARRGGGASGSGNLTLTLTLHPHTSHSHFTLTLHAHAHPHLTPS